jgi:plasmid replication initiation protein
MSKNNSCITAVTKNNTETNSKKQFKKDLMDLFQKFGYLSEGKNHEVTFRTTSGSIAWISINSIETIK